GPQTPGSGAAVDIGCSNAVGVRTPQEELVKVGHISPSFIWHHPDAADSVPAGTYHCNHEDMGPHGHQGLITVTVADKHWKCTATYKGTEQSVKDGTASEPVCPKIG